MTVLSMGVMRELALECDEVGAGAHVTMDPSFYTRADDRILIYEDGLNEFLHRKLWKIVFAGDPIDDLVLVQTCDVKRCFNPYHHEARKTSRPPMLPGSAPWKKARKTICVNGHRLAGDNLQVYTDQAGYKHRACRQCKIDRSRARTKGTA